MTKLVQLHHIAWLSRHPERTEEWLRERLLEGFDVHHLDGNHGNNDPANLVLIDANDHMLVHGMNMIILCRKSKRGVRGPQKSKEAASYAKAEAAFYFRKENTKETWRSIGARCGLSGRAAMLGARKYAEQNGFMLPVSAWDA